jgi:hypothetical protein
MTTTGAELNALTVSLPAPPPHARSIQEDD